MTTKIEKRHQRGTVEIRAEEGGPTVIAGYGAVFYDPQDRGTEFELWQGTVERILPGAFDQAIRDDDVRGLFNHDSSLVLGRTEAGTMRLSIDEVGLRYEIDMPDTTTGRDVAESIRRRDVTGSSFSFVITDEEWRTEDGVSVREVSGVKLYDVGPVTFPAYSSSSTDLRCARETFDRLQSAEEQERAARRRAARDRRMRMLDMMG